MNVEGYVHFLTVFKDGRFIAAESLHGVLVWDAMNYRLVFVGKVDGVIWEVDFSPDSTRLIAADGSNKTVIIWDIAARRKVQTLGHSHGVYAAKYSPQGDGIVTASSFSVQVWDSDDGCWLLDIEVAVVPQHAPLL